MAFHVQYKTQYTFIHVLLQYHNKSSLFSNSMIKQNFFKKVNQFSLVKNIEPPRVFYKKFTDSKLSIY